MAVVKYGENLPDACPPNDASEDALGPVLRLVPVSNPDEACFASKRALDIPPPPNFPGSPCEWASCSLNTSVDALLKIRGLVKRNPFIAKLEIPASKGKHNQGKFHINFWRYADFSIPSAVVETWEHNK